MILGVTAERQVVEDISRKRQKPGINKVVLKETTKLQRVAMYHCDRCGRQTRQRFHGPTKSGSRNRPAQALDVISDVATRIETSSSSSKSAGTTPSNGVNNLTSNANSKRRAKVRKQGGLQALLAKKKEADSKLSGGRFGLDLMDFMKKA
jgi:hypothetical protein